MSTELPTLPLGTVLQCEGCEDRKVTMSYPGLCLVVNASRQIWAMAWIEGAWRSHRTGGGFTVRPDSRFTARVSTFDGSWLVWDATADHQYVTHFNSNHPDPEGAARAEADRLNEVQS